MSMKSSHKFGVATNASGVPISNASVTVYLAGTTTKPPIWSDEARTSSLANPFNAGSDGYYEFYGLPGIAYRIQVSAPGAATRDVDNIQPLVPVGQYGLRGFRASNNAATQATLSADSVILRGASDLIVVRRNTGNIVCDLATAGPVANGRDQAGAFANSTWIHLYFIWNAAAGGAEGTLATIASTTAPPTGPALPTDYTHWAYATAMFKDSGGNLRDVRAVGSYVGYRSLQNVVTNGAAVVETALTITGFVPPNALTFVGEVRYFGCSTDAGGNINTSVHLRYISGSTAVQKTVFIGGWAATGGLAQAVPGGPFTLPNVSQTLFYHNAVTAGSSPQATIDILGYTVPNGGA